MIMAERIALPLRGGGPAGAETGHSSGGGGGEGAEAAGEGMIAEGWV